MKLGIIGLPGAGKTTIFRALTKDSPSLSQNFGGRFDVVSAMVDVPDRRVDELTALFRPKKSTYAKVTYADVAGMTADASQKGGLGGAILNFLSGLDGFVHVVRAFESDTYPHPEGSVDPARDLATLDAEMILSDLLTVEGRLERLREGLSKGAFKGNKAEAEAELALFETFQQTLAEEKPLRTLSFSEEEAKELRGYGFLSLKPVLAILNTDDETADMALEYDVPQSKLTSLRGRLEMELAQLSGDDLALFMDEYGVTELGLDRVIRLSYELMDYNTFFTVGEDEVRAWRLRSNGTALDAAGTIHSDLAKGFIRAEVIQVSELLELGGMSEARAVGRLRLEGKTYVVQDGDIVHIKFNL